MPLFATVLFNSIVVPFFWALFPVVEKVFYGVMLVFLFDTMYIYLYCQYYRLPNGPRISSYLLLIIYWIYIYFYCYFNQTVQDILKNTNLNDDDGLPASSSSTSRSTSAASASASQTHHREFFVKILKYYPNEPIVYIPIGKTNLFLVNDINSLHNKQEGKLNTIPITKEKTNKNKNKNKKSKNKNDKKTRGHTIHQRPNYPLFWSKRCPLSMMYNTVYKGVGDNNVILWKRFQRRKKILESKLNEFLFDTQLCLSQNKKEKEKEKEEKIQKKKYTVLNQFICDVAMKTETFGKFQEISDNLEKFLKKSIAGSIIGVNENNYEYYKSLPMYDPGKNKVMQQMIRKEDSYFGGKLILKESKMYEMVYFVVFRCFYYFAFGNTIESRNDHMFIKLRNSCNVCYLFWGCMFVEVYFFVCCY